MRALHTTLQLACPLDGHVWPGLVLTCYNDTTVLMLTFWQEIFEEYSSPTQIEYRCDQCGAKQASSKQASVCRWPHILVLHLARFSVDEAVPLELRMSSSHKVSLLEPINRYYFHLFSVKKRIVQRFMSLECYICCIQASCACRKVIWLTGRMFDCADSFTRS